MKTIKIQSKKPDSPNEIQEMTVEMEGGSPYFGFIWIDDVLFIITKTSKRGAKISRYK